MGCQAIGCSAKAVPEAPFCADHWALLDPFLQGDVTKHLPLGDPPKLEAAEAVDGAVAHLAWVDDLWSTEEAADWLSRRARARLSP